MKKISIIGFFLLPGFLLVSSEASAQRPLEQAKSSSKAAARGERASQWIQKVVHLKHMNADEAAALVKEVTGSCRAGFDLTTNTVVIAGPHDVVEMAVNTLMQLDTDDAARERECSAMIRLEDPPDDLFLLMRSLMFGRIRFAFAEDACMLVLRGSCDQIEEVRRLMQSLEEAAEEAESAAEAGAGGLQVSFYFIQGVLDGRSLDKALAGGSSARHPTPRHKLPSKQQQEQEVLSTLDKPVRSDFDDTPLEIVIKALGELLNVNIIVLWSDLEEHGISSDSSVTLQLASKVPFGKVLQEVLDQVGGSDVELGFTVDGEVVKIASRDRLSREVFTETYDVSELLAKVPHFKAAPDGMSLRRADGPEPHGYDKRVEKLIDLIRRAVAPDSWRDGGGKFGWIDEYGGQLVVTQTASAQTAIAELLDKLHAQRDLAAVDQNIAPLPELLEPVADALAEQGFHHTSLLAPLTIHARNEEKFEFTGWADQLDGMIRIEVKGQANRSSTGDFVELEVRAGLTKQLTPAPGKSGFEHVFGVETSIFARLDDFVVLATSPSSTDIGKVIILVVRMTAAP
ncbi:MAG: hypothetical protein KAV82_08355 [Phycisphaerae bacterium]|nr:hypothetical protein [Phycisphaerae bacterium]